MHSLKFQLHLYTVLITINIYNLDRQSATTFNLPFVYFTSTSKVCKANDHLTSSADLDSVKYVKGLCSYYIHLRKSSLVRIYTTTLTSSSIICPFSLRISQLLLNKNKLNVQILKQ